MMVKVGVVLKTIVEVVAGKEPVRVVVGEVEEGDAGMPVVVGKEPVRVVVGGVENVEERDAVAGWEFGSGHTRSRQSGGQNSRILSKRYFFLSIESPSG